MNGQVLWTVGSQGALFTLASCPDLTSVPLISPAVEPLVMIMLHFLFSINCTVFRILVFGFHSGSRRINGGPRVERNQV